MLHNGDPVRISFLQGNSANNNSTVSIFDAGSNVPYPFAATDFFILDSITVVGMGASTTALQGNNVVQVINAPASTQSAGTGVAVSTLMLNFPILGGFWMDHTEQGMGFSQGQLPTIGCSGGAFTIFAGGTGHVTHSPGNSRPSFLNSQVPTG